MNTLDLIEHLADIACKAGDAVMAIYNAPAEVAYKADGSPVTEADRQADAIIIEALSRLTPHIPVISEESVASHTANPPASVYWLVDPLDGTREFIVRNGEFTINIALIDQGVPVLGVVYAPALGHLYAGDIATGAWQQDNGTRRPITCRLAPAEGLTVLVSRSHSDEARLQLFLATYLANYPVAHCIPVGSSLKLCMIAAGQADLYPRLGRTMEWDIAAGHAVLAAAGGQVLTLDGLPLTYGKPTLDNPDFVARGL